MTGIQAWTGDKPECELHLKKRRGIVVGVEGQYLRMRGQMLVLADIKAGSVSFPVAPVPFLAQTEDRSLGLGYSD